ncbi:hypothetical protein LU290_07165 [Moraxella nasibovis]|uniref:hypothetical protein n=1 Tax=Moraxella TaxID=475 RepID=UPI000ABDE609|nr:MULTISPECIES: hypothetical protein [Moraxella]WFF38038.1 hypothetical protein LU290_07165 [Moraxella nasibovis]
MNIDDYTKIFAFLLDKVDKMKNSRYWSLWFFGLFTVTLIFAPNFIHAIKWW